MNLVLETLILGIGMASICLYLFFSERVSSKANILFLFGTGAFLGIFLLDLVPDVLEMGGGTGLFLALAVGSVYSLVHFLHLGHHHTHHEGEAESGVHSHGSSSFFIFFISIVSHCFASGALLYISEGLSQKLAGAVFLALLTHKGYECVIFLSILKKSRLTRQQSLGAIGVYCLSLPAGAAAAWLFRGPLSPTIVLVVSSVAVGSLLGCLIFDFLIPSYYEVKKRRFQMAWLILGLILTRLVLFRM